MVASRSSRTRWLPVRTGTLLEHQYDVDPNLIGSGSFGQVYLCTNKQSGAVRVAKTMVKSLIPDQDDVMREITIQCALDHPNICRIFDCFETSTILTIVIENCRGGDLCDAVDEHDSFCEGDARHFMTQILMAVNYMHGQHIVHRDLKPENFLLKEKDVPHSKNQVKVVDFGFAREFGPNGATLTTKCGTPHFTAPEIFFDDVYNEKCDIWSCGVILCTFLSGAVPFDGSCIGTIMQSMRHDPLVFDGKHWDDVSSSAKEVAVEMLQKRPGRRASAAAALRSPWFQEALLSESDPNDRVKGKVILKRIRSYRKWSGLKRAGALLLAHSLPDAEQKHIRATFEAMDTDHDGRLTLEELRQGLRDYAAEDINVLYRQMVPDGGSGVEWTEFLAALSSERMRSCLMACKEAFTVLDSDGDGRISLEEMHAAMQLGGSSSQSSVRASLETAEFRLLDEDNDGFIDFDDFVRLMTKLHAKPPKRSSVRFKTVSAKGITRVHSLSSSSYADTSAQSLFTPHGDSLCSYPRTP